MYICICTQSIYDRPKNDCRNHTLHCRAKLRGCLVDKIYSKYVYVYTLTYYIFIYKYIHTYKYLYTQTQETFCKSFQMGHFLERLRF